MTANRDYLHALSQVMEYGIELPDRTGIGCKTALNTQLEYGVGEFPFSLARPMGIKNAWEEMKFFLSGERNSKKLEEKGIMFWKGNTSREFLDARGLQHLPEGSMGASYSEQFRSVLDGKGEWIDQVQNLIAGLMNDPHGRRHSIDLWNITDQWEMPLLPCWWRSNWFIMPDHKGVQRLHLKLYSRSCDLLFGYHQAAMQYRLFQIALSALVGVEVGIMVTDMWNVHVYRNQYEYVEELLKRDIGTPGTVHLDKGVNSLDDILNLEHTDFVVEGYEPNRDPMKTPRPEMAV